MHGSHLGYVQLSPPSSPNGCSLATAHVVAVAVAVALIAIVNFVVLVLVICLVIVMVIVVVDFLTEQDHLF